MKLKLIRTIVMLSKYTVYGLLFQALFANFLLASSGTAQKSVSVREAVVSLNPGDFKIEEIFDLIENRSDYRFAMDNSDLKAVLEQSVQITGKERNLSDVLIKISKQSKLRFRQINDNITVKKIEEPWQATPDEVMVVVDVEVSGQIIDENGQGLPGASVVVKGGTHGTTSDLDGNFSITVDESAILIVSFVGYTSKEIPVGNSTQINVQLLPDSRQLSEIVVTAFGIEKEKKALGYATQELDGEGFTEARETNIVNKLAGKVAGVQVTNIPNGAGGSARVVIRGNSSIAGNDAPLYVVDGIPIDNQNTDPAHYASGGVDYGDGIGGINPDDVETLTVLKGPNAAALYGSRAANGVILITTKSGKSRKGIGVSINSNVTFDYLATLPTFQNKFTMGYDPDLPVLDSTTINGTRYAILDGRRWASWGPALEGQVVAHWADPTKTMTMNPQPIDNVEDFFDTGVTTTNTIALTGGNEKANIRFSVSDMHNKGLIPGSTFERQTLNLRGRANITDRLSIDSKVNYVHQKGHNRPELGASSANPMSAIIQLARHIELDDIKSYKDDQGNPIFYTNRMENPYWTINEIVNDDERNRIIGFVSLRYKLNDWLSIQARTGTDFYTDNRFTRRAIGTRSARTGSVSNYTWYITENNSDILLLGDKDLSDNFSLSFTLGANHLYAGREVTGASGTNLRTPGLYHINNANEVMPRYQKVERELNAVFGTAQIAYKNFLFLDVAGRNDWSSVLGINNYSFFYPSVSSSFAFTDAFEINSEVLTFGKIRAGYAEVGNGSDPYLTSIGYVNSIQTINGQGMASVQNRVPNPNLKNELTKSYEFGADMRFFSNRIGIDFTYYNASARNQILPVNISSATGFGTMVINAGEITNEGVELMLNATPIDLQNNFRWNVNFNFSKNKSKVVSLADGIETHELSRDRWGTIEARPGEDFGNIVGWVYKRNEKGEKLLDGMGSYQRDGNTTHILGNIQPDWLAGLTNQFSYKGVTVSALIDIKMGGEILSGTKYIQAARGTGRFTTDDVYKNEEGLWVGVADGVMENDYYVDDGSGNQVLHLAAGERSDIELPRWFLAGQWTRRDIIEEFVLDASYVSLREVTLEYSFPKSLLSKLPFTNVKLAVVGRNLAYLVEHMEGLGITPEAAFNTQSGSQGSESYTSPSTRSIGFNVKLDF